MLERHTNATAERAEEIHHSALTKGLLFALGILLLTYTVVRAVTVSFSWDENWTFIHHVLKGVFYQRTYDQMGANHHLLNVWAMWLSWKLFGDGTLALRLPNLLAYLIYLYASGRIALKARSGFLAVAVFVLLNVHPYLLDFFSLARGYGLACGFMMLAFWHVWRYFDEGRRLREVLWVAFCGSLAAMSNLIMIDLLLSFGLSFLIVWVLPARRMDRSRWLRSLLMLGVPSLVGLGLILPETLGLLHGGSLYFGCDSFWTGMVLSLGEKVLYHQPYATSVLKLVSIALASVALVCLSTVITAARGSWLPRLMPMFFGMLVLCGCLLAFFLEHWLFQVPFPRSRTALFLLPLAAFILAAALVAWPRPAWSIPLVAGILCIPLVVHQYNSFNLTYAVEWKPEGEVARMFRIIAADHLPLTDEHPVVTLCSGSESHGCINYYQYVWHMQWLVATERLFDQPYVPSDYYIVEYNGYDRVDAAHWKLLYRSEATNTNLYRDQRWRDARPKLVFHSSRDMESNDLAGRSTQFALSGNHSLRFDTLIRSMRPITWTVPADWDGASIECVGTGMVLQSEDSNWLSFVLSVLRNGQEVAHADVSSALQMVRFGSWNRVGIRFRPSVALEPGDVVQLSVWPLTADTPLYLDDLQLSILR